MRMFLVGMCDIFLILYLTAITNVQPRTFLTIEDFYKLKQKHEALEIDKEKAEEALSEQLRRERQEKEELAARLEAERKESEQMEETLHSSDAERERIAKDLQMKEQMLQSREKLLEKLNQEIAAKEEAQRKLESSYQKQLAGQKKQIEQSRQMADMLKIEANEAQRLANQMQEEAALAVEAAETARSVEAKAVQLKEAALKEKQEAERKADEALAAKFNAEEEKARALKAADLAEQSKEKAEAHAQKLAADIKDIKQDGETAYKSSISPQLQTLQVTFERRVANDISRYERELTLLPVRIDGKTYALFPSQQVGFSGRGRAPDKLVITYRDKKLKAGLFNNDDDLIAVELSEFEGAASAPHPADAGIQQLMPALLALRNNGDISLADKLRGLSEDYFLVNRDYLQADGRSLKFNVPGFRGTGLRGERIVRGDQLVDLKGRLIGVAADANIVLRIDSLKDWKEISF